MEAELAGTRSLYVIYQGFSASGVLQLELLTRATEASSERDLTAVRCVADARGYVVISSFLVSSRLPKKRAGLCVNVKRCRFRLGSAGPDSPDEPRLSGVKCSGQNREIGRSIKFPDQSTKVPSNRL